MQMSQLAPTTSRDWVNLHQRLQENSQLIKTKKVIQNELKIETPLHQTTSELDQEPLRYR